MVAVAPISSDAAALISATMAPGLLSGSLRWAVDKSVDKPGTRGAQRVQKSPKYWIFWHIRNTIYSGSVENTDFKYFYKT